MSDKITGNEIQPKSITIINSPEPASINLGVDELQDIVDAIYKGYETYILAMANGSIDFKDTALLGGLMMQLFVAFDGVNQAWGEFLDLTDEEISALVDRSDNYQLGNGAPKIRQIVKEILIKGQTVSVFRN